MTQLDANLDRLLAPKSIALFGGSWARNVLAQLQKCGFEGEIWPVHPSYEMMDGLTCYPSVEALPRAPDAAFIGVNRFATVDVVRALAARGTGGAICFASGFSEDQQNGAEGAALQNDLIEAAGEMAILGPNCYGLLNYLDTTTLWPDQHGGCAVERGVALIGQSSNILLNLTMQARGLPISHVVAMGNQAQISLSRMARHLLNDKRVTALGLYIEGFEDLQAFALMAKEARALNKPIVAIKAGKSEKAQAAALSHTASLAGGATAASAFLSRLGCFEVDTPSQLIEVLKIMHVVGPLSGNRVVSMSCSGGEASLMADMGARYSLVFPEFSPSKTERLKSILGPVISVANPLDYHTFIWHDAERLSETYSAVIADYFDVVVLIMDIPPDARCDPVDWQIPLAAARRAGGLSDKPFALLASLPENMPDALSHVLIEAGIIPLHGLEDGIAAIKKSIRSQGRADDVDLPLFLVRSLDNKVTSGVSITLNEVDAKAALASHGLIFPKAKEVSDKTVSARDLETLTFPVAVKGLGIAHKTEAGAVRLNLNDVADVTSAMAAMGDVQTFLIEEMVPDKIAEILVGVTRDQTGLFLLTIGAGGILAELLDDTRSLLVPSSKSAVRHAIADLKVFHILNGYRGGAVADLESLVGAIMAIQDYVLSAPDLIELDVNPIIVRAQDAIAVDALIRLEKKP